MLSLLGGLVPAPHTVKHRAQLEDGGDGPRWADPVEVKGCRIEPSSRQHQTDDGRVVTLTALVWMPAKPVVEPGDRLIVDGDERLVERVEAPVSLDGQRMHHEVWTT